ncbi:MobA/MobL family protein, partial [Acinetobacter ursingii]|uniref:MobA/MobL family protein n=1 Tax=Acinetobacter ursingii TaxID=108980 RepID=UPI003AF80D45
KVWNLAEKSENRKDARTAREWVIALPDELDEEQRKDLAREFAQSLVDRFGVVADLAIHAPSKCGDDKNHLAHILLTTRKAELDTEN